MKAFQAILILILLNILFLNVKGAAINPPFYIVEDSVVYVLKVKHKKKKRQLIIPAGTEIQYWVEGISRQRKGVLEGFLEDKALIIDGEAIPVNKITKIKKKDTPEIKFLKFIGVIGMLVIIFFGGLFSLLFFSDFSRPSNMSSTSAGLLTAILSIGLIALIGMGIQKESLKNLQTKYEAKIVAMSVEDLRS